MNASETIKVAIEFVSKQVDPGGGGTVTPVAQTGDIAIWAIMAILFVGVIAYCMFKLSRVFNSEYTSSSTSAKHAKNAIGLGRFATIKAVLIVAIVGLIACLSITTTTAIAKNANNGIVTIPDKIQIPIDEETGQPDPVSFQFLNNSTDYTYFKKSSFVLSSEAQSVSSLEDWNLTLNAFGTCIFTGNPSGAEYTINDIKVFEPLQKSDSFLSFSLFNFEAAKALIGKEAFEITLTCSTDVAFTPEAITGMTYNESEQTGVLEGANYSISGNKQTIPGNYTATATLTDPTNFVWEDGTKADKQISWSIGEAPVNVPVAKTGLVYQPSTEQIGVEDGKGYSLINNKETNAGDYTAEASLDQYYVWSDASHNVKEIPWSIAKANGGFTTPPSPVCTVYSSVAQDLVTAGSQLGDGVIVYKLKDTTDPYTTTIPTKTDVGEYTVLAHVNVGTNYTQSEDVEVQHCNITPAHAKVTIKGEKVSKTYNKDVEYAFPNYLAGEKAYTVDFEMVSGPEGAFDPAYVFPGATPPTTILPIKGKEPGFYPLGLNDSSKYSFSYTNSNLIVDQFTINDGGLQINEASLINMQISHSPESVKLGERFNYTISLWNKSTEVISGAEIYLNYDKVLDIEDIPVGDTPFTTSFEYEVVSSDFIYNVEMYKLFTFYLESKDYYEYEYDAMPLTKIGVDAPTPYKGYYDGTSHTFPTSVGYAIKDGDTEAKDAGTYRTTVILNLGYKWSDGLTSDERTLYWEIKKINVNFCFETPDDTNTFTVTYGNNWKVDDQTIVAKTSDVQELPDTYHDILGDDPYGSTNYQQWSKVVPDGYAVEIVLPSPTNAWNKNYNITKTDARLNVVEKDIKIKWPTAKVFKYTENVIDIEFSIEGSLSEHPATVSYTTYADQARTTPKQFIDTGSYYVSAHLGTDADSLNYKIAEGAQPSEAFEIKNALNEWPKAVLSTDYSLKFIYDDVTYKPGGYFILNVYDIINTSYSEVSTEKRDPLWSQDADIIKKVTIMPNFANCSICSDGTTALTSMDSWFANMQNLEKIEGLENIHADITSLNATYMNTKLNDYTFPKGFFDGVVSTHSMFKDCSSIEEIGVLDWTYASFARTRSMFENCSSLKHIYCLENTNWTNVSISESESADMFKNCNLLHNHSTYTDNDITYAKVDKEGNPGFFEYPSYDNLYQYTVGELKVVSDYLAKNYTDESQDPVCLKFINFRESGLTPDGSDNGVAMKAEFSSHWAIDKNGKLFGQEGFVNDNTTIQARIIGICEDYADKEQTQKIGLTFMTTHALNTYSTRQVYHDKDATYGWGGESQTGSCALRRKLNDGSLFPKSLIDSVKKAAKGFQYSGSLGSGTVYDKFWAPSMFEMYGPSGGSYDRWWPDDHEGKQYSVFDNKDITHSSFPPFRDIDIPQNGDTGGRTNFVWSRSLYRGLAYGACDVYGRDGGDPFLDNVGGGGGGVVSCFCI